VAIAGVIYDIGIVGVCPFSRFEFPPPPAVALSTFFTRRTGGRIFAVRTGWRGAGGGRFADWGRPCPVESGLLWHWAALVAWIGCRQKEHSVCRRFGGDASPAGEIVLGRQAHRPVLVNFSNLIVLTAQDALPGGAWRIFERRRCQQVRTSTRAVSRTASYLVESGSNPETFLVSSSAPPGQRV